MVYLKLIVANFRQIRNASLLGAYFINRINESLTVNSLTVIRFNGLSSVFSHPIH